MKKTNSSKVSRRQFIKKSGLQVAGTTMALNMPNIVTAHAAPDQQINIGLVGCGGRGTGAALDAVHAATNSIYPDSGYHTENAIEGTKATWPDPDAKPSPPKWSQTRLPFFVTMQMIKKLL